MRFADVIGHDRVIERLQRATASGRLPHTYLFSGPEGVGKYTTACALAARLLCDAPGDDSCGSCAGCAAAVRETHPDFVVVRRMDGAAEVKIDQVRELQRLLGKKTLEAEILKEAFEHATGSKKRLRLPPSPPKDGSR